MSARLRAALAAVLLAAVTVAAVAPAAGTPRTAAQSTAPGALPDPGDTGPLPVSAAEYDDGDTAYTPPGFGHAVEVRASVHYPTGLPGGPYPLIVLLHGRHSTCYLHSSEFLEWPCAGNHRPIPSFQGYDYLAANLASWGYVVISISANGINAFDNDVADLGATARARLIQHHLDKWQQLSTAGGPPFGDEFVGKVDLTRVGTMGHSRGGEGVVRHYLLNQSLGAPYRIQAVLPLAPVDFSRPVINGVPLDVILPYCDGDVSDLQGVHFYDDARYNVPGDAAPKHTLLVMGANHNFFNTIWTPGGFQAGAIDDWDYTGGFNDPQCSQRPESHRLTAEQQRAVGLAYMAGFFRLYIGGETELAPYFDGSQTQPPSTGGADVHAAYHAPAGTASRLDVNRFLSSPSLTVNDLGGAVTRTGASPFALCGGPSPQPPQCLGRGYGTTQQPHTTPSYLSSKPGLSQLRTGWAAPGATITNALPAASRDVSGYRVVSFRIGVNIADARNPDGTPLDLSVRLTDASGGSDTEAVSTWSDALFAPPGDTVFTVPKVLLDTVRIPLSAFTGVDLHDIDSVSLVLDRSPSGGVLLTDLAFADQAATAATLAIDDVTRAEGTGGSPTIFSFTITLSAPQPSPVGVHVTTADGTALAGEDYTATDRNVVFRAGVTSQRVAILVTKDAVAEPDETFFVDLSAPNGAVIVDGQGRGNVTNDD